MPLFDKVEFTIGNNTTFTIRKEGNGKKIQLMQGKELTITTTEQ
ncbi:hypothetical protein [Petrimonas sp.]|nr:hypothetical protein [Petrimonas sp.]